MSGKAVIVRQRRVFDDCFKIDELLVTHGQIDGTMSAVQKRLVFERGDSIAVLLLHVERKSVVLVEQFKVPALVARRRDDPSTNNGWIVETAAGMIDADETPEAAAIRETFEETGYRIQRPRLIGKFFSSPGGTSERVFLYFAEISDTDRAGQGGGIGDEDIKVVQMGLDELFARLARGSIEDPKLLIAAYWLQNRLKSHG
jgi:ADP-ribose pyrophosphatase